MKIYNYIFIILLITVLIQSCDKPGGNKHIYKDTIVEGLTPDQTGWNVTVRFVDSSTTKAILVAGRTRVYQKRNETLLDGGIEVQFFSTETGERTSKLTADSAVIDDNTKNMVAKGNVIVIADSSGTKLETSVLHWNNKTRKIYSSEYVEITSASETLKGWGFESDENLNNYKIFKVSGEKR